MFLDKGSVCAESSCIFYCFNFFSVAMELCRFACLTCQHRELLRPLFLRSQRSRVCSGGDAHAHLTLQEWGHHVWVPAMPSSGLVEDESRGTSSCRGLVVVAVSRVWKVASLWGWGMVVGWCCWASGICKAQPALHTPGYLDSYGPFEYFLILDPAQPVDPIVWSSSVWNKSLTFCDSEVKFKSNCLLRQPSVADGVWLSGPSDWFCCSRGTKQV